MERSWNSILMWTAVAGLVTGLIGMWAFPMTIYVGTMPGQMPNALAMILAMICGLTIAGLLIARFNSYVEKLEKADLRLCRTCSYDLQGSAMRCPECGTEFDTDDPASYASAQRLPLWATFASFGMPFFFLSTMAVAGLCLNVIAALLGGN